MSVIQDQKVFFMGSGSISEAIIKGIVSARLLAPEQITICNRTNSARLEELQRNYGVSICHDKQVDIARADIIVLAVKPFDLVNALQEIAPLIGSHHLLLSVVAGASTNMIEQCLQMSVPIIRAMPNTSSFVQTSATAICQGQWATSHHLEMVQDLFSAIGISVVVEEVLMNAVTGLSGTGPAYFYYVVEALLEAGKICGLPSDICRTLLIQTLYGAATMLRETGKDPGELRRQVTSPNGTTMAAITALEEGNGSLLFLQAVQRATQRASEMMDIKNLMHYEKAHGAQTYLPLDVVLTRGEGVWVYDSEGRKYLDGLSAYSALNQGHCHPQLVNVMTKQVGTLTLTSRAFRNDQYPLLLHRLSQLTGYDAALPMNTGVEAVETAIKLARKWAYTVKGIAPNRAEIIVMQDNFHGRSITAISCSTERLYREHFGPYTPGFVTVPYGDIQAIESSITPQTAAILLEPIQGEAGVIVPPEGYLQKVRKICDQANMLMLVDEIQTGLGRTGKLFAYQHEGIRPDMVIIGKALSGGMYPVSAVLADRSLMDLFQPGEHGSTFGGNPLGAAVAIEALNVLIDEQLIENAAAMGTYALQRLRELSSPLVKEVRGKGLLIGIKLQPEAVTARRFCETLKDEGILCKETHEMVIRFAPPLIIDQETLEWALSRIAKVLHI